MARLEADRFISDRLSRRSLAALVKSRSACVLVACPGAHPVGYAVVLTRRGGRSARLYSIAVAAEQAGRGVGTRLLEAAADEARRRGAERLHLEVRADNPGAVALYERCGYRPIGARPDYYEDGIAALLFARDLTRPTLARVSSRAA